ncbi:prolyl aminopeptidase [Methylobacillus flagellatus]|uniref:Proline iminopeptidase n=1 Tax=Methylobacillus flagellatus (strain ATCC 51484 / DSM 6875 / VKM B-1610 / KT) TaxID=265072 RepID=Q1GYV5_METFK|nr:prolyl aminopeptidase [Methylobacillus flagellatus]ABE50582.1 prolyl aminopeptidase, Serine peptidase, MEROPS family S33 [Methylobacillus flagellatus KT]
MNHVLFPDIQPYQQEMLPVSDLHALYYEQSGNPAGQPVIFLHGGPGSGCNPGQRRYFDPGHYRIILVDQRGCGRSTPQGEIRENTTSHLVNDLDTLRKHLGIDRWLVFGGSWGSTLALNYALAYPQHVTGLILRGIFLSRPSELEWFLHDVQHFFPESWHRLLSYLPVAERHDPLTAFAARVFSDDPAVNAPAAIHWNAFESSIMTLLPVTATSEQGLNPDIELARARVQIHYIKHQCFLEGRNLIAEASAQLRHIPTVIVQGRYDMVCPPLTAYELHQAMPHAEFHIIPDAGHSGMEAGTRSALIAATEKFKQALQSR